MALLVGGSDGVLRVVGRLVVVLLLVEDFYRMHAPQARVRLKGTAHHVHVHVHCDRCGGG